MKYVMNICIIICNNLYSFCFCPRPIRAWAKFLEFLTTFPRTHTHSCRHLHIHTHCELLKGKKNLCTLSATECRHKHTHKRMHLNSHARKPILSQHTQRERERYMYIHVRHPTHLENWLLSPLSGDTCYLFCAHIAKQKLVGLVLCALFLRKKTGNIYESRMCFVCVCLLGCDCVLCLRCCCCRCLSLW